MQNYSDYVVRRLYVEIFRNIVENFLQCQQNIIHYCETHFVGFYEIEIGKMAGMIKYHPYRAA